MNVTNRYEIYTVSRLNTEVRTAVEGSFPSLKVEGEISNLSKPVSGHLYFSLKDQGAQVRCALFRSKRRFMRCEPKNGDKVLIRAKVTLYETRGDYQLVAESMALSGDGALGETYERLKEKLQSEGLFASASKQPLPSYPAKVGIITSPSGAVIHDVISVLQRRYPLLHVDIYPVSVQGDFAAKEMVDAISQANQRADCDLLLLTRGGGSLEDLMAFNDESLARAVFKSALPIMSAVGHEIDFTLVDFVADVRAPTPSVAAELMTPDRDELWQQFSQRSDRLKRAIEKVKVQKQLDLASIESRLQRLSPNHRLMQQMQRLDYLWLNLWQHQRQLISKRRHQLDALSAALAAQKLPLLLSLKQQSVIDLDRRLILCMGLLQQHWTQQLAQLGRALNTLSPLSILDRGYAMAKTVDGDILCDVTQIKPGESCELTLARGSLLCEVVDVNSP